jgi:hypothetical protein
MYRFDRQRSNVSKLALSVACEVVAGVILYFVLRLIA